MKKFFKKQWPLLGLVVVLAAVGFYIFQGLRGPAQGPLARDIISGEGLQLKDIHYVQDNPDEGLY